MKAIQFFIVTLMFSTPLVVGDLEILSTPSFYAHVVGTKLFSIAWHFQDPQSFNFPMNLTWFTDWNSNGCDRNATLGGKIRPGSFDLQPNTQGRILNYVDQGSPCDPTTLIRKWAGWADVLIGGFTPGTTDTSVVRYAPYDYQPGDPALMFTGADDYHDVATRRGSGFPIRILQDIFFYFPGSNVTVRVDFPRSFTGAERQLNRAGTYGSFILYAGLILGIFQLVLSMVKISQFHKLEGGVKLSIPQMVLGLCAASAIVQIWVSVFFELAPNHVPVQINFLFGEMMFPLTWTAVMIMGFFFKEVSMLTSSQSSGALDKMKIPAIIVLSLTWAVWLAQTVFRMVNPPFVTQSTIVDYFRFISMQTDTLEDPGYAVAKVRAAIYVICIAACAALIVYGVISLLIQLKGSATSRYGMIIRIIVLSSIMVLGISIIGLMRWVIQLCPAFECFAGFQDVPPKSTWFDQNIYETSLEFWHQAFVVTALIFAFHIQTSEEIEVSKSASTSGTSSTSGSSSSSGSSSGSSSSSSASGDDVAIEL